MVDIISLKQLYPTAFAAQQDQQDLQPPSLRPTENPPKGFFLLLPSKIMGFSMQTKRWGKFLVW
jgi:hypothetical protein